MQREGERYFEGSVGQVEALGESEAFMDFQERLSRVAQIDRPVLIVGERGTGKELAVSRLHYLSRRWQGPLVALNCASLSPSVLESELFGHESGAFTGAMKRRIGRFEAADEGSLFLDEIGLIPLQVQEKILRVVEYRQFERVGGSEAVRVDVRIIGATNADLPKLAAEGKFKRDLLDRLSFEVLFLPPLRERGEDIALLARNFAARMSTELGWREVPRFTERAIAALEAYPWPGNIRELKNVVERAVYASMGNQIDSVTFDPFDSPYANKLENREPPSTSARVESSIGFDSTTILPKEGLNEAIREYELGCLKNALEQAKYHQGEAAELLKLTYHQFRGLYRKHKKDLEEKD